VNACASAAGIDDFVLKLAEWAGFRILDRFARVVRAQPTIGAAMEALGRYVHIHMNRFICTLSGTATSW